MPWQSHLVVWAEQKNSIFFPHVLQCVSRTKELNFFPACSVICGQNKKNLIFFPACSAIPQQIQTQGIPGEKQERSKSSTSVHIVTNSLFYLGLTSSSQFPIRIKYFLEFSRQVKMILHSKWKKVILDRLQTPPHKVNKVSTQISFEFIILKTFTFTSWKISFHVNIIILWERFSWQSTLFQIHPDITHSRCGWYVKNAGQVSRYKARGVKKVKVSVSVGDTYHTYLST